VIVQAGTGALGAPGVPNVHLFAGERFDDNQDLVYLRARWMDPRVGRFSARDLLLGNARTPLTLNQYLYANLDPINHVDPSGEFTLSGVSTGASLSLALNLVSLYTLFENADEIGDSLGLLGTLIVAAIGGPGGFDSLTDAAPGIGLAALATLGSADRHHTIPIYMCGPKSQRRAHLEYSDHVALHAKLYAGVLGINLVSKVLVDKYLKKPGRGGRQPSDAIVLLAKKRMGREVIGNFLEYFYRSNTYWDLGRPTRRIRDVFPDVKRAFVAGSTSLPTCKR